MSETNVTCHFHSVPPSWSRSAPPSLLCVPYQSVSLQCATKSGLLLKENRSSKLISRCLDLDLNGANAQQHCVTIGRCRFEYNRPSVCVVRVSRALLIVFLVVRSAGINPQTANAHVSLTMSIGLAFPGRFERSLSRSTENTLDTHTRTAQELCRSHVFLSRRRFMTRGERERFADVLNIPGMILVL